MLRYVLTIASFQSPSVNNAVNEISLSKAELSMIYRLIEQELSRIQEERTVEVVELEELRSKLAKEILNERKR